MASWRSASEQVELPVEAEMRRFSEWPIGPAPGSTRLFAMDPSGITLTHKLGGYDATRVPDLIAEPPSRRFNVVLCGAAAAISTNMLTWGARLAERCMPKYEPLLLICVKPFPLHPSMIANGVNSAVALLRDHHTLIDAIVWYDIEHPGYDMELLALGRAREKRTGKNWLGLASGRPRPRVPILALRPFASWEHAAAEWASVRAGRLMSQSHDEYLALRAMIETGKDDDANALLQRIR